MNTLIDIGGSGIKIADYSKGLISNIEKYNNIKSYHEFVNLIRNRNGGKPLSGIAISIAGFVIPEEGRVTRSRCAPYLEGEIVRRLKKVFPLTKIAIVNDGEAHARALLHPKRNVRFGAIHLGFGTSVSFGVINSKREIVRTCSGENWDIGDYILRTSNKPYEVWYKLGSQGLADLEKDMPGDPYYHFGLRAGGLLTNLAVIFRPRTIGLSGGIMASHGNRILDGIKDEFRTPPFSEQIEFVLLDDPNIALEGLETLL